MTLLKDIITEEVITSCLTDVIRTKFRVDSNNFGGVMFEMGLASRLRKQGFVVYTQKEVETLQSSGVVFDLGYKTLSEFKRAQKDITSSVYASDLFLFSKGSKGYSLIDWASMKTSINDNDGSFVFIANDAEGVIYPRILEDSVNFKVGKVLIISANTETLKFSVDWFEGEVGDITSLFSDKKVEEAKVSFNLKDSSFGSSSRQVVKVMNRNSNIKKKATSFDRGFVIRRDFIPQLSEAGVFSSLCSGSVSFDKSDLVQELMM